MKKAWVIRPNPHGIGRFKEFLDENIIAIGWPEIGELKDIKNRNDVKEKLKNSERYNYTSPQSLGQAAGTIYRFTCEIEKDDYILVPNGKNIIIGKVLSKTPIYNKDYDNWEEGFCHRKNVEWLFDGKSIERKFFTSRVYDSLKGQGTLFTTYFEDVDKLIKEKNYLFIGNENENIRLKKQYLQKLKAGKIRGINSNNIEDVCCILLNKYFPGIKRQSTNNCEGEGDTDLKAELIGKIVVRVQIKNFYEERGKIDPWVVDQLAKSMEEGDNGIILTTTKISKEAEKKAEKYKKGNKNISFIDGEEFVDLIFSQIDSFSREELIKFGLEAKIKVL